MNANRNEKPIRSEGTMYRDLPAPWARLLGLTKFISDKTFQYCSALIAEENVFDEEKVKNLLRIRITQALDLLGRREKPEAPPTVIVEKGRSPLPSPIPDNGSIPVDDETPFFEDVNVDEPEPVVRRPKRTEVG